MQLGPYSLGEPIATHPEARKLGWWGKWKEERKIPGETLYTAPNRVEFVNVFWRLVLGVFQDHIYRLSARFSTGRKDEMESVVCRCGDFCSKRFGSEMRGDKKDAAIWDAPFGRVTVNIQSVSSSGKELFFVVSFDAIASLKIVGEPHGKN
jgi:hypothetical protein